MRDAARLSGALPYIDDRLARMKRQVKQEVYKAIRAGEFTPEHAQRAWYQYHGYDEVLRKMSKDVKTTLENAETTSSTLNLGVSDGER
jgi:flagellar hook-basal body complex protein FliE